MMVMYTMLFDGAEKRSRPYVSAERTEEPGDRLDRRGLGAVWLAANGA
jgi:hypothetical protein